MRDRQRQRKRQRVTLRQRRRKTHSLSLSLSMWLPLPLSLCLPLSLWRKTITNACAQRAETHFSHLFPTSFSQSYTIGSRTAWKKAWMAYKKKTLELICIRAREVCIRAREEGEGEEREWRGDLDTALQTCQSGTQEPLLYMRARSVACQQRVLLFWTKAAN